MKLDPNNATNKTAAHVGDREITITRVFKAARDLVFEAWTKAEHLAKWWGPRGFTSTFQEFDMNYSTIYEETAEVFDKVKIYAAPGAEEMLKCLEEHLAGMAGK